MMPFPGMDMPDPEEMARMQAHAKRFSDAHAQLDREQRIQTLHWAAVMCVCTPRYVRDENHPAGGCPIHSSFYITAREIL